MRVKTALRSYDSPARGGLQYPYRQGAWQKCGINKTNKTAASEDYVQWSTHFPVQLFYIEKNYKLERRDILCADFHAEIYILPI